MRPSQPIILHHRSPNHAYRDPAVQDRAPTQCSTCTARQSTASSQWSSRVVRAYSMVTHWGPMRPWQQQDWHRPRWRDDGWSGRGRGEENLRGGRLGSELADLTREPHELHRQQQEEGPLPSLKLLPLRFRYPFGLKKFQFLLLFY